MPKTVEVTLGGHSHTITELPALKNAAWRQGLTADVMHLVEEALGASNIKLEKPSPDELKSAITTLTSLGEQVAGLPSLMLNKLLEYAPELEPLSVQFYDSEVTAAFMEVCKLAFPFGTMTTALAPLMKKVAGGLGNRLTGSNSESSTGTKSTKDS